jgi:hypothetical protein
MRRITVIGRGLWIVVTALGVIAFLTALYSERFWIKLALIALSLLIVPTGIMKIKENEHTIIVSYLEAKKHGSKNIRMGSDK